MAQQTKQGPHALPTRLYGSFAGKSPANIPRAFIAAVTAQFPTAVSGPARGSFAGKASLSWISYGIPFYYESDNWKSSSTFYLEGWMRNSSEEIRLRLYDVTAGAAVQSSDIETSSTSLTRVRSAALTLTDGNLYRVQVGGESGNSGDAGAKLIVVI